jgi:hypothetical protein
MSRLDAARALGAQGFAIFPIKAGAKFPPKQKNWPAFADAGNAWHWDVSPRDNIGIHCKGLLVVDVDPKKGGNESLDKLDMLEGIPPTLTTRTPTGGRHLFFRLRPGDAEAANTVERLGPGLDTRGANGYVVAPGSEVPAGTYQFVDPDAPIAEAPEWLVRRVGSPRVVEPDVNRDVAAADESVVERARLWLANRPGAIEGEGGDAYTYATACAVRDMGLSQEQTMLLLMEDWNDRCAPPWDVHDLGVKVVNAYKYAENPAGSRAALPTDFPVLELSTIVPKKRTAGAVRLAAFASQDSKGAGYVVKGFLQRASYAEIYGAPGEGKTYVTLDVGYHIAADMPWRGHKVHSGPVLYLAYEGRGGLVGRAKALRQHYGDKDVPLYVASANFSISTLEGRAALGEILASLPEKPVLIVFDTFAKALMGGDENSAQDVGAFNGAVEALIESTGACVLIVHHSGKDKTKGARGSSALLAALDTEIEVDGGQVIARKQRDLELGEPIGFKLTPLVVGIDSDGDEQMSCIVEPAQAQPTGRKLSGNARRGFEVLCAMSPQNEPVHVEDWREACVKEFLSKSRSSFFEMKKQLLSKDYVDIDERDRVTRRME